MRTSATIRMTTTFNPIPTHNKVIKKNISLRRQSVNYFRKILLIWELEFQKPKLKFVLKARVTGNDVFGHIVPGIYIII